MKNTHALDGSFGISSQGPVRSWPRRARGGSPAAMESLEDRALFSVASLGGGLALPVMSKLPAVQAPATPGGAQGIIAILVGL